MRCASDGSLLSPCVPVSHSSGPILLDLPWPSPRPLRSPMILLDRDTATGLRSHSAARVDTACATSPIADMLLPFPWPVDHIPDAGTMAPSGIF